MQASVETAHIVVTILKEEHKPYCDLCFLYSIATVFTEKTHNFHLYDTLVEYNFLTKSQESDRSETWSCRVGDC